MSTWDTEDDQTRLSKLLDDPWPAYSESSGLPSWVFWLVQAGFVALIWYFAVGEGRGRVPAWLGGLVVACIALTMWIMEIDRQIGS